MSGGENSCSELVAQIRAFTQYEKPYDLEYVLGIDNILSITSHNAGCECVFSIIGWIANKRRTRDYDNEDEDYDQNEDEGDDTKAANNNKLKISRWVNIMDKELQELLQTEVKVIIDISSPPPLDHGFQEFNMEEVLDRILT
ncbi:unnamed protein product [Rhizophagus irregularis]|uniref:Uncharacterized protein n=1 Tax=Rhizophagus irregularis TaxID=588596 RepID=A0A915YX65_9GLOM|nr:unnamed protein product [Rhizophagus irregularis]